VLLRVAWRLQVPPSDPIKAALFDEGHHQERALKADLRGLPAYEVALDKLPIDLPEHEIAGEVDFSIGSAGARWYVTDAKAVSPGIFRSITTAEDLWSHRRYWARQWPLQLLLYLCAIRREYEAAIVPDVAMLILKDKVTGDIHPIPVPWDETRVQAALARLARINATVAKIRQTVGKQIAPDFPDQVAALREALPPVLADPEVCRACPYYSSLCATEIYLPVGHLEMLDHPDLEGFLELREQHKPGHEEYDAADAEAKALLKQLDIKPGPTGKAHFLVGPFLVTASEVQPRGKPAYWKFDIWRRPDPPRVEP
jgi:hypothetical protein